MRRRPNHSVPTGTITIRIPKCQIARLERKADGALMSRSAYVETILCSDEPELCPALAALAQVIAIHEIVATTVVVTPQQISELKLLVLQLAQAAHREADALL